MSLPRGLYGAAIDIFFALSHKKLKAKYTEGNDERQGLIPPEKLATLRGRRPIWVHAVSVGEVQAAVPFIKAARDDGWEGPFVISTTTQTGKAMAERLGKNFYDLHIYYPWDKRLFVRRALDALRPAAFAAAETELWPNMLWECRERGIPAFLINGRISDRTWARVQGGVRRGLAGRAYSLFSSLFLRDEEDRERLSFMGVEEKKLFVTGDGKIDALLARRNEAARDELAAKLGEQERPIFLAGSTHTGEDEKIIAAFAKLREKHPEARLVIAPRHPERAQAVASLVPPEWRLAMFSNLTGGWDVLIIDRIGVLFDLYGTARAAFVGGSFADKGGQNILEPFSWGVPVQYGPHMEDFAHASRAFLAMGAAHQVADEEGLARVWLGLAEEGEGGREKLLAKSREYFGKSRGASARTWEIIKKYLLTEAEDA